MKTSDLISVVVRCTLQKGQIMRSFLRDETGGEVLEYALIAGLIVVAAIAVIGSVGTKVLASWNSVNSSM
jgi:Flp pilus assembly pilin Flp